MVSPIQAAVFRVVFAAVIAAGAGGCVSRTVAGKEITPWEESPTSSGVAPIQVAQPTVAAGPVRDGGFEFTVWDIQRVHRVGDASNPGLSVDARGIFIVIGLAIRNVGNAPNTFIDRDQTLLDTRGTQYTVSNAADIYGNLGIRSTRITPGDNLNVHIAFDVPSDTVVKALILHGSSASPGAQLALP